MDDDVNDFQSQNLHLADEGSTKFPPVLRQYALPKFDFDDSIQGHLRFDILAETEVFLGIEDNEDNQWIEHFSRENSGVEFRTRETEDCSRRKNVWSEATSSESVEMLLKSVGPEDITPSQATTEESNACDKIKQMKPIIEHGNKSFSAMDNIINLESTSMPDDRYEEFSGVMEPSIRQCDSIFSEMKSVLNLEPISLSDEVHENFSTVEGDTRGEMPLNVVALKNLDGTVTHVDSPIGCVARVSLEVEERFQISDWNSDLLGQSEVDPLVKISLHGNQWEDSCASGNPIDGVASSIHNLAAQSFEMNNEQVKLQTRIESSDGSQIGNCKQEDDESGPRIVVQSDDQMASSMKNVEENVDGITNGDEHSNVTVKLSNESHVGAGQSEIVQADRLDDEVVWKRGDLGDQSEVSVVPVFSKFNKDAVEVIVSHICSEICTGQESEMTSTMMANVVIEGRDGLQLNSDVLVSETSSSVSIMENHEVCKGKEYINSPMREGSSVPGVSCGALSEEIRVTAALSSEFDACGVLTVNLKATDVKAVFTADPIQICEDVIPHAQNNVHDLHVSVSEDKGTSLIDVSVASDYHVDGVQSSISGEPVTEKKLVFGSAQCHESDRKESAVSDSSYDALLSIGDLMLTDIHVNPNKDQFSNSEVCPSHMDERDEDAVEVSAKESVSSLLDSSQLEARSCPVSCAADDTSIIIGEKMLRDRAGHLVLPKDNFNMEAHSEPEADFCDEVGKNCTKERVVVPKICETVATIGESLDIVSDSKQIPPDNQMLAQSMAKTSLETEESNEKTMKEIEDIQTVSTSGGENNGQVVGTITDAYIDSRTHKESSSPVAFSHSIVQESDDKSISPDVIKDFSSFNSENKFSKEPSMQALLVFETVDVDALNECSTFQNQKNPSGSEIERSLSSAPTPMEDLSKKDSSIDRQYSPAISVSKVSPILEESLSCSRLGLVFPHDARRESLQASDKDTMGGHHKGSMKLRARRSSVKGTGKESSKKGNLSKTVKSLKQSERGEKSGNLLTSPGDFHLVQSHESEHYGHMECSSTQPLVFVTTSTSSLSDLNNSTSPSAMFQQPFTDLQQVELRAQIFVYGALIQGVAPDEAYMSSAFGGPDGGRSWWGNAWRMCMERLHGQKSYPISPETSLHSQSGTKVLDEAMKKMTPQSKVIASSPVNRVRSEGTGAVLSSMIPPSSPLWNISTPSEALQSVGPKCSITEYQQALSPFFSFQTPPTRNLIGVTTSWLSQAPFRSPLVATSQTTMTQFSSRLSGLPITEPVHLTPQREPFIPQSSGLNHPGLMVHNSVPTTVFPGPSPLFDTKRTSIIHLDSSDPKPKKRKKIPAAEDQSQILVQSSHLAEQVSFPMVGHSQSPSVSISNSSDFSAKDGPEKLILPVSTTPPPADTIKLDQDVQQRGHVTEETLSQVKDARQLAEVASACAAGAVQRGQEIWSQLGWQSYSELESCIQARISSAAVAVAAAEAVAKAAAAAAKVASNAALLAKLMAEEAFASTGDENSGPSRDATTNGIMHSVGKDNSVSKLMINGETNSSSIIFAAKEAARKRVEATTAASKQAENMDAIVKAAELAAEAVSQAGKIVAMGEPLLLTELLKVVPGSRLKVPQLSNEIAIRSDEKQLRIDNFGDCSNSSAKSSKGPSVAKENRVTTSRRSPLRGVISKDLIEYQHKLVDFVADAGIITEDDLQGKADKISNLAKTIDVNPESKFDARSTHVTVEVTGSKDNTINEGSCVEILKDGNGLKAAWFLASVLSLKDAEAYVCYNDLQREEGSGPLMEWVPLESQVDQPPKIRISHPVSAKLFKGTRKRRRDALNDHAWSVGDRVDAWVQDSWREGVVSEKNQKDGTTMTIHFPANGETSVVKIWHLRPSLVWKDGKWVEWSSIHGRESAFESDVPREKRLKLGIPLIKAKGKDNIPKLAKVVEPGLEDSRLLVLSANERAFNVGNSGQNENKSYPLRTARTGLQEGSRVIFGVPKPGKKRKFMDVSKHYVGHHYKTTGASDSVNFVKNLVPQRSGPGRLKHPPRPVIRETRETENKVKQAIEMKPQGTNKSGKPPNVLDKTLPRRENYMKKAVATPMDGTDSEIHAEKTLGKQDDRGPISEALEASLAPFGEASKKMSSSNPKLERANKGKLAPGGGGKLFKIEENKVWNSNSTQSTSEIEPRRSVRRIQPTSRLLEGLQSSLTISKNPSAHEKSKKILMKPAFKVK